MHVHIREKSLATKEKSVRAKEYAARRSMLRRGKRRARSFDADPGLFDDAAPARDVVAVVLAELVCAERENLHPGAGHALLHLRRLQDMGQIGRYPVDDGS